MVNLVSLPGSTRRPLPGATLIGEADPQEKINHVSIYLRPTHQQAVLPDVIELSSSLPTMRRYMTHAETAEMFRPDPKVVNNLQDYLKTHGVTTKKSSAPHSDSVLHVTGNVGAFEKAFGVQSKRYAHQTGNYRGRTGPIHLPADFVPHVHSVFGLDNRRVGHSYRRVPPMSARGHKQPFTPPALASLYNFPTGLDGSGQTVAILAFNGQIADTGQTAPGGYDMSALKDYFQRLGVPLPKISNVVVHGPGNTPGDGSNPEDVSGEVMLDIQMVGLLAPGANIVVYFSEFTEVGWVDAINAVVSDATNNPSILSISYGNPETASDSEDLDSRGSLWTHAAIVQTDLAFQTAAAQGMTIFCASGDNGSPDGDQDGLAHTDYPSSSAYVTGVGGTSLLASGKTISRETVWNDGPGSASGGGVSDLFSLPDYQDNAGVINSVNPGHHIGRGIPDVAAVADPSTGVIIVDTTGQLEQIGGTSAAAPLWAALAARVNQGIDGRIGFLNPLLYSQFASGVLHDITSGNNGSYRAKSGWDACTGLGSPDGNRLLQVMSGSTPQEHHVTRTQQKNQLSERIRQLESIKEEQGSPKQAVVRPVAASSKSPVTTGSKSSGG